MYVETLDSPENKKRLIKARRETQKLAGRRLPKKPPKGPRQATGKTLERAYYSVLLNLVNKPLEQLTQEMIIPQLPQIAQEFARETRVDSSAGMISDTFTGFDVAVEQAISEDVLRPPVAGMGKRISDFNAVQVDRQFKSVLGVNPLRTEPYLAAQLENFTASNIELIKTIPTNYSKQLQTLIQTEVQRGTSTAKITELIQKKTKATRNRSRVIARDQVNKFNGSLSHLRQTEVGITHYVWRTSLDERVRSRHAKAEGVRVSWESNGAPVGSGGEKLHPGQDYQCRCYPEPDLSEFL